MQDHKVKIMKRGLAILLAFILFPAAVKEKKPDYEEVVKKVIAKHGTYLDSTDPMECGGAELDEAEKARISKHFKRVAGWPNFRASHTMGIWGKSIAKCHVPTGRKQCHKMLKDKGVVFAPVASAKGIINPVELESKINGVKLVFEEPLVVDCDFALALHKMTKILADLGVEKVNILSLHRPESPHSFHALGLGMDMNWFKLKEMSGNLYVKTRFEKRDKFKTCNYEPVTKKGKFLMDFACKMWEEKLFNTILTPNYNPGHDNHFHVDLRPGDNRFYLN